MSGGQYQSADLSENALVGPDVFQDLPVRNITIRFVRYSLRPLVFYFIDSLFVADPVSNAGLGSFYTVFPLKLKARSAVFSRFYVVL